uniref:Head-to-tail stopper n=1 Tax=Microbacterium phage Crisis TaxID=3158889 RepID=A0AAU8GNK9_9CAUD
MSAPMVSTMGAEAMGGVVRHLRESTHEHDLHDRLVALARTEGVPRAMGTWMKAHNGQTVTTRQYRVDPGSQEFRGKWEPGPRKIDANRASRVVFIGPGTATSDRLYEGVRAIRSDDTMWVGYDVKWHTLLVFEVVS